MRFLVTWTLYFLGDLISRLPGWYPYRLYNWLMVTSSKIQGEREGKWWVWAKPTDDQFAASYLGDLLYMLAELHPDDQSIAYKNALSFYNSKFPESQIMPEPGFYKRLVITYEGTPL